MAETMEDVSKAEVDAVSEEVEGDGKMEDNSTIEPATVAIVSAAGDVGNDTADVDPGEHTAVDSTSVEEEKHVIDESDAVEAAAVSEADAAGESAANAAADATAAAAAADDNVAVVTAETETDESKFVAVLIADETATDVSPGIVDEKPDESDKVEVEASADATTDRVEHVTCKADKVTVSVETPAAVEISESVEVSCVDTARVETKSKAFSSSVAENKTTQDVMNMAGNDELKFGVLIGLVRVGQLSNKDVVDSVLCLVGTFCFLLCNTVLVMYAVMSSCYQLSICDCQFVSVCASQVSFLLRWLNVGSRKQHHHIPETSFWQNLYSVIPNRGPICS